MKIEGNNIREGMVVLYNKCLYRVTSAQHIKPGKGVAYMQTELRNLENQSKTNIRFGSKDTLERVVIEQVPCTYLYDDDSYYIFMNSENYEQIYLAKNKISNDQSQYFTDELSVELDMYDGDILGVTLPTNIDLTVEETDAALKGQTATSSYKSAVLSNGMNIMVPPHITSGIKITVNTNKHEYVSKAKS